MPSPFPGIDPFIESQRWPDFHADFIASLRAALVPRLRPRYAAHIEERVYVEHDPEQPSILIRPDLSVVREGANMAGGEPARPLASTHPIQVPLRMPRTEREPYLEIRTTADQELVTVIELLSPSNKRPHGNGRREYLAKRDLVLLGTVHLVELDFLRGGEALPMDRPLPPAYGWVIVSDRAKRPMAAVWPLFLRQPLPRVGIPLAAPDSDVGVDLQEVFAAVYDHAGYDYTLHYDRLLDPPLAEDDEAYVRDVLARAREDGG